MGTVRTLFWALMATAFCLILAADVCQVSKSLAQKDAMVLIADSQDILLLQAKHVTRMEETLTSAAKDMLQMQQQVQLLEKSLETSVLQVQGLIDDNSKLEAELDANSVKVKALEDELLRTQKDLEAKIKELEEANNHG
jgi:hypothetical protein